MERQWRGGIACCAPDAYISIPSSSRSDGGLVKLVLALTLYPHDNFTPNELNVVFLATFLDCCRSDLFSTQLNLCSQCCNR